MERITTFNLKKILKLKDIDISQHLEFNIQTHTQKNITFSNQILHDKFHLKYKKSNIVYI